jgi:NitT/TauT family transport system substrate-binding protein
MNRSMWIKATAITAGAALMPYSGSAQSNSLSVRLGFGPGDPFAQGYFALDGGFLQRAGLTAEIQTFGGGGPISEAVASGTVDIGSATTIQVANAVAHGIPFILIAPGCLNTLAAPSGFLIVAKSSPTHAAKDLEGQVVAISQRRSITELALITWLRRNGADPTLIKTIEMPFDAMGPALERGTVAAAVTVEPAYTTAVRSGAIRFFGDVYGAVLPRFLLSGWIATADFVRRNSEAGHRFLTAMLAVARWANRHHMESAKILVKYSKTDPDIANVMVRSEYAETLQIADIQPMLDLAASNGLLSRPISAAELIGRR